VRRGDLAQSDELTGGSSVSEPYGKVRVNRSWKKGLRGRQERIVGGPNNSFLSGLGGGMQVREISCRRDRETKFTSKKNRSSRRTGEKRPKRGEGLKGSTKVRIVIAAWGSRRSGFRLKGRTLLTLKRSRDAREGKGLGRGRSKTERMTFLGKKKGRTTRGGEEWGEKVV